jgi:hypothetical protein
VSSRIALKRWRIVWPGLTLCREYFDIALERENGPWAWDCRACALARIGEGRALLTRSAYTRLARWIHAWPIARCEDFRCPWPNLSGRFITWDSVVGVRLMR